MTEKAHPAFLACGLTDLEHDITEKVNALAIVGCVTKSSAPNFGQIKVFLILYFFIRLFLSGAWRSRPEHGHVPLCCSCVASCCSGGLTNNI